MLLASAAGCHHREERHVADPQAKRMTTCATVLAAVETDSGLPTERDRCTIYRELAEWGGGGFTREEYATAGSRGCADFPYDGYPWQ